MKRFKKSTFVTVVLLMHITTVLGFVLATEGMQMGMLKLLGFTFAYFIAFCVWLLLRKKEKMSTVEAYDKIKNEKTNDF